jgi:hypothetical protein
MIGPVTGGRLSTSAGCGHRPGAGTAGPFRPPDAEAIGKGAV